jgi:PAS domain S-box-containing protein
MRQNDPDGGEATAGNTGVDFAELFRLAPIGLAVLDSELRYVLCNDALSSINGLKPEEHIGRSIHEVVPGIARPAELTFRRVFQTGEPVIDSRIVGELTDLAEHPRTWLESVQPIKDAEGKVAHILVSVHEITPLEEAEAALRATETALHVSQKLNPDAFTILRGIRDAEGTVTDFIWEYANPAAQSLLCAGPLKGRSLLKVLPANRDHPDLFPRYVRLLNDQSGDQVELRYDEGEVRGWFRNTAVSIDPDRLAVSFRDITARKAAEEQLKLVGQEYRHRVKNLLTVVSSLVSHAGKDCADVPALQDALQRQLTAMGAAQDLLSHEESGTVSLASLAAAALKPFAVSGLHIGGGAEVPIHSRHVVPLALALNELATNAAKYGSLSSTSGRVYLTWSTDGRRVSLSWTEKCSETISRPDRVGFGSRLLEAARRSLSEGELHVRFEGDGLRAQLSFNRD